MNILYVHGFGSRFDPDSDKVNQLSKLGHVYGITVDHTFPAQALADVARMLVENDIDLMVGTSMGGWLVNHAALLYEVPFVAINPCVEPAEMLKKYDGAGVDHYGKEYYLDPAVREGIPPFREDGIGIILLDLGDEVIDSLGTLIRYGAHYEIHCFEGGNHRFAHMAEALPHIEKFQNRVSIAWGFGAN